MTNTMTDLHREVQHRLYETIDDREMNMVEGPKPRIPHMLGITSMNAIHTRYAEEDTLLDPDHQFWQEYEDEINTKSAATRRIESAIRSLKQDNIFEITYPHGEESDIVYCEVEPVEEQ